MSAYLVRRFLELGVVVLFSTVVIYALLNAVPGGPLSGLRQQAAGSGVSAADLAADFARLQRDFDLDLPLHIRYARWLIGWPKIPDRENRGGILFGDMGTSWAVARGQPVAGLIRSRLGNTLTLMTTATLLSLLLAIPIGIYAAVRQYSLFDYIATTGAFFGVAMPVFWFGMMVIIVFAFYFKQAGWFYFPTGNAVALRPYDVPYLGTIQPESSLDRVMHLILPTAVFSLRSLAAWSRFTRSSMLEVLRQDYVRTARAKGLIERVVIAKHALRNALIPLVTIVALTVPALFAGAILTETVFNWPGMGRLYINALNSSDWPLVMGLLFITALLTVFSNLLADVLYTVVDPRIRLT
jgi:peptide/nickel transport system permease protein